MKTNFPQCYLFYLFPISKCPLLWVSLFLYTATLLWVMFYIGAYTYFTAVLRVYTLMHITEYTA